MKKALLLLVLILVLVIGYKYNFTSENSHTNSRYGFKFSYDNDTKLESRGNAFTCGNKYDCASFTGSPSFSYTANYQENLAVLAAGHEDVKIKFIGRTEQVQQGSTIVGIATYSPLRLFYEYNYENGKVYKNYITDTILEDNLKNTDPSYQTTYKNEELLANETVQKYLKQKQSEAVPSFTNKNNVNFYPANWGETPAYCTFEEVSGRSKAKIICIISDNTNDSENTTPTGSLLYALETFKFK